MHHMTIISFILDYYTRKIFRSTLAENVGTSSLAFLHFCSNNTENSSVHSRFLLRMKNTCIYLHIYNTYIYTTYIFIKHIVRRTFHKNSLLKNILILLKFQFLQSFSFLQFIFLFEFVVLFIILNLII